MRPARRIRGPRDLAGLSPRSREAFANSAEVVSEARRRGTTIAAEVERGPDIAWDASLVDEFAPSLDTANRGL